MNGQGKLPIYIPIKGTNLHETIKEQTSLLASGTSNNSTLPLSYSQSMDTMTINTKGDTKGSDY